MSEQFDIAIVGGGLVGSCLAAALADTSYRIALIDSQPLAEINFKADQLDGRSIALALSSKKMFSALGMWEALQQHATPIKKIHISDQGRFGVTRLDSARYEVESFGYLVPADHLIHTLNEQVDSLQNVTRIQPYKVSAIENNQDHVILKGDGDDIQATLLIAADGANSFIRKALNIGVEEKQYQQSAIVGSLQCEQAHNNTAYERFTDEGPLALLPREGDRCGFIWMNPTELAEKNLALDDQAFIDKLQSAFGFRLGHIKAVSKRFSYPLALLMSEKRVQQRVVLIGNAAQTLHPIAGQGLNLALRDIAELVELLDQNDLGNNDLDNFDEKLREYENKRQPDIEKTVRFTDRLNFLFNADYPVLKQSRGFGLAMLGAIPVLEERIVKQNLGEAGSNASLLKGKAVNS